MDYQSMSSLESDFADHPDDGPPGAFIVWIVPVFWPFLIILILLSIIESRLSPQTPRGPLSIIDSRPSPQTPRGPTQKALKERSPQTPPSGDGLVTYRPLPHSA